jgi:TPR repeat protein
LCRQRPSLAISLLLGVLLFATPAIAGLFEDGDLAFKKKDYEAVHRLWMPLAEAGHSRAQLGMATLYYGGLGVTLDYARAFDWCAKSADQGEPQAQYVLGSMYRDGKGVERNPAKAMTLLQQAADRDVHGAQYSLGLLYLAGEVTQPDYPEAYFWLDLAARAAGKEDAQLRSTAAYARDQAGGKLSAQQLAAVKQRVVERKPAPAR